jgi:hypothetical protein
MKNTAEAKTDQISTGPANGKKSVLIGGQ